MSLDVFDLCTEKLQQKLMPIRAKFKEIEDKKVEEAAVRQMLDKSLSPSSFGMSRNVIHGLS